MSRQDIQVSEVKGGPGGRVRSFNHRPFVSQSVSQSGRQVDRQAGNRVLETSSGVGEAKRSERPMCVGVRAVRAGGDHHACAFIRGSLRLKSVRKGFPRTDTRPLSTGRSIDRSPSFHIVVSGSTRARSLDVETPSFARPAPLSRLSHSLSLEGFKVKVLARSRELDSRLQDGLRARMKCR